MHFLLLRMYTRPPSAMTLLSGGTDSYSSSSCPPERQEHSFIAQLSVAPPPMQARVSLQHHRAKASVLRRTAAGSARKGSVPIPHQLPPPPPLPLPLLRQHRLGSRPGGPQRTTSVLGMKAATQANGSILPATNDKCLRHGSSETKQAKGSVLPSSSRVVRRRPLWRQAAAVAGIFIRSQNLPRRGVYTSVLLARGVVMQRGQLQRGAAGPVGDLWQGQGTEGSGRVKEGQQEAKEWH